MINKPLHITVGAIPSPAAGSARILEHELRIAKAAILYADKVNLCSGGAAMASNIQRRLNPTLNSREKAELFLDFISIMNFAESDRQKAEIIIPVIKNFVSLSRRNPLMLTRRQRQELLISAKMVDEILVNFQAEVFAKADEFGMDEIRCAVNAGVLDLQEFNLDVQDMLDGSAMIPQFVSMVQDTLLSDETHPLFDSETARLVETGIMSGRLSVTTSSQTKGRQTGLVADLFGRLPVFDIPMNTLLDVRNELSRPLTHFRGEMVKLSSNIESAQWDASFPSDVESVVQAEINPALAEIEEKLRSIEFAEFWTSRIVDKWSAAAGLIGGSAAGFGAAIGSTAAILAALAGAAVFAQAGSFERTRQRMEIERNGIYFYHRLDEMARQE